MNVYRLALLASAGAAAGFLAVIVASPTTSSATETAEGPPPRVRIEHQFVRIHNTDPARKALQATVDEIRVPANPPKSPAAFNVAAKSTPTAARASSRGRSSTGAERSGILPRVGRLLVGDGRHRPEPFPRPGE